MELIRTFVKNSIQLNVYGTFEKPLFMAQEIGDILNMTNIREQIRQIDSDWKDVRKTDTPGGAQQMTFLTEPGLYYLIMRSNKPEAKIVPEMGCYRNTSIYQKNRQIRNTT